MLKILCDVCADIPVDIAIQRNIICLPMVLSVNDEERIYSASDFDCKAFYDGMRAGDRCSTSQIVIEKYKEFFMPILESGDDIIYVSLSSGLSGSYGASLIAIEELKEMFPERKIYSVDSLAASLGEGLLVLKLASLRDEGKSFDDIVKWAEEYKHNVMLWFTVDDLKYLQRGGRVSKTTAIVGTIFDIKPVLQCNCEGKLVPFAKVKGRKRAIRSLVESIEKFGVDINGKEICISHGDCLEDAMILKNAILEKFPDCTFIIGHIGAVIGSHSGPGTLALFFMGEKRFI